MIYERIVDFDTVQISLFKQKNEKAWFPIRFFGVFGLAVLMRASIFILLYNIMLIMFLRLLAMQNTVTIRRNEGGTILNIFYTQMQLI